MALLPKACNFIEKETPIQVFFCEYCEIFKKTYFEEYLRTDTWVNSALISTLLLDFLSIILLVYLVVFSLVDLLI